MANQVSLILLESSFNKQIANIVMAHSIIVLDMHIFEKQNSNQNHEVKLWLWQITETHKFNKTMRFIIVFYLDQ